MLKHNQFFLTIMAFLLNAMIVYTQEIDFLSVVDALSQDNYTLVETNLSTIDTTTISSYDKATWLYYYAELQYNKDNHHLAYKATIYSKEIFKKLNKEKDVADCNMLLLSIISHQNNLKIDDKEIIKELTARAKQNNDTLALRKVYYNLAEKYINLNNRNETIKYFNKIIAIAKLQKNWQQLGNTYTDIGITYDLIEPKNIDSCLFYYKKAVPILKKYKNNQSLSYNYNNQGTAYKDIGNYKKAIVYYKKADSVPLKKFVAKTKVIFYENIADAYFKNKDYENAVRFLQKQIQLQDSINDTQQNIAISEIKEKYDNEKLRADNLVSEAERIKNRNLLFATLVILFFSFVTGFLIYKNIIRKKHIIEKERQLEQQKVTNLLKEQELIAIDAMIEGQEKERQLIASDLHDDLGALMATLQLNFENLDKHKNSKDANILFAKTKSLISEAYQKIRKIAHAKNSGVIAKQGLLKAIKNNATKISQLNNIDIEVREYGLENRLENSLELMIFRIVQELIANIIKHAQASEVTIHFTNHEDLLNIMVEDNGIGFDTNSISKSNGMGIHSIEKRIESIEGSMTIESIKGRGTTVILDIPI